MLTGCASVNSKPAAIIISKTNITYKNYVLGVESDCNVGDKIIARKNISGNTFSSQKVFYRPSNIAVIRISGADNKEYQITKDDKIEQIVISKNGASEYALLIDDKFGRAAILDNKTGLLTGKCIYKNNFDSWLRLSLFSAAVDPPSTVFNEITEPSIISVDKGSVYENIEIIFVGRNKNSLNLLYREYSSDDLARVAFFQNLTYDIDAGDVIRFKSFKIQVIKSNNELIRYKVIEE